MWKALLGLLTALPEILKLIENIQRGIDEKKIELKVKDDVRKINEAFEKKDPEMLRDIFRDNRLSIDAPPEARPDKI